MASDAVVNSAGRSITAALLASAIIQSKTDISSEEAVKIFRMAAEALEGRRKS